MPDPPMTLDDAGAMLDRMEKEAEAKKKKVDSAKKAIDKQKEIRNPKGFLNKNAKKQFEAIDRGAPKTRVGSGTR